MAGNTPQRSLREQDEWLAWIHCTQHGWHHFPRRDRWCHTAKRLAFFHFHLRMNKIFRSILVVLLLVTAVVMAIEPQIQALVSNSSAEIGEIIQLQVVVTTPLDKRAPDIRPPKFPRELPFRVTTQPPYTQRQSSYSIINGKAQDNSRNTTVFTYNLIPQKSGSFTIPALTYKVNGTDMTTEPITLNIGSEARNASATAGMTITQEFTPSHSVLGGTIKARWQISVPSKRSILRVIPQFPLDELRQYFKLPDSVEEIDWHQTDNTKIINGTPYRIFGFELDLTPRTNGTFTIPGAAAVIVVRDDSQRNSSRRPSFFDDDFFDDAFGGMFGNNRTRDLAIAAPDSTIVIDPLPTAGRPADFCGLLGKLSIEAKAEPTDVSVGDPILLTITLNGVTALDDATMPDLRKIPAFAQSFRVSGDDPAVPSNNTIVFQRTIRAINDQVTEIPALTIPYYDPERGCYDTATSQPIPLTVTAAKQITLADASGATNAITVNTTPADTPIETSAQTAKRAANNDWRPNHNSTAGSANLCARSPLLGSPIVAGLAIVPPAAWLILALLKALAGLRNCNPTQRAARNARKNFLRVINSLTESTPDAAGLAYAALQSYIIAQYRLPSNTVTLNELNSLAIPEGKRDQLKSLLMQCENAKFAGAPLNLTEFKALANKTV